MTTTWVMRNRAAWIAQLRSDQLEQAHGALRVDDGYCCLGVAEATCDATRWRVVQLDDPEMIRNHAGTHEIVQVVDDVEVAEGAELTHETAMWLGLVTSLPYVAVHTDRSGGIFEDGNSFHPWDAFTLAELNDEYAFTLPMIANVVADQPPDWDGSQGFAASVALHRNAQRYPRRNYRAKVT